MVNVKNKRFYLWLYLNLRENYKNHMTLTSFLCPNYIQPLYRWIYILRKSNFIGSILGVTLTNSKIINSIIFKTFTIIISISLRTCGERNVNLGPTRLFSFSL